MIRVGLIARLAAILVLSTAPLFAGDGAFRRGDCNGDGNYNIGDPIVTLSGLFSGATWNCRDACDANDDGATDISDAIFQLGSLFAGGPTPPPPFPDCGIDLSLDTLGCVFYPTCDGGFPPTHFDAGPMLLAGTGNALIVTPEGFFGPGSEPFVGTVVLSGNGSETAGPFEVGTTDTVIRRLAPIDLDPFTPSQNDVAIELVELHLRSVAPITVTNNGILETWDVSLSLLMDPMVPRSIGTMDITQTSPSGGVFQMDLPMVPRFVFSRFTAEYELVLPPVVLSGSGLWNLPGFGPIVPVFSELPTFAGSVGSPQLQLQLDPANPLPIPPYNIVPGADVDPSARIGRGAHIELGAQIGPNVVIGPHAFIGPFAIVQAGSIIGNNAVVGPNCVIGANSVVDSFTQFAPGVQVGSGSVIGAGSFIESGAHLGANVRLGVGCSIGQNANMGVGVELGDDVFVGNSAFLFDGVSLPSGVTVFPGEAISESLVLCVLPDGTVVIVPAPVCYGLGAVMAKIPGFQNDYTSAPVGQQVLPLPPGNVPGGAGLLGERVDGSGVAPANGGGAWVKDTHDCDDFADELEQALEVFYPGQATFTCIWEVNKNKSWWQFWLPDLINGHALTDLHHDGKTLWIEPQWSAAQGAVGIDMDKDGDGQVEYATSPGSGATDGCYRIEVYDNRAACEAAGRQLD